MFLLLVWGLATSIILHRNYLLIESHILEGLYCLAFLCTCKSQNLIVNDSLALETIEVLLTRGRVEEAKL